MATPEQDQERERVARSALSGELAEQVWTQGLDLASEAVRVMNKDPNRAESLLNGAAELLRQAHDIELLTERYKQLQNRMAYYTNLAEHADEYAARAVRGSI